jgi:hypothetical protein
MAEMHVLPLDQYWYSLGFRKMPEPYLKGISEANSIKFE